MKGRRSSEAILTAENPEATDVLTFESVAGADGDLTLEIPANYQTKTPEGHFLQPKQPGTFRFRIPQAVWSAPEPTTDAGPGKWATVGPVSVSVVAAFETSTPPPAGVAAMGKAVDAVGPLYWRVPPSNVKKPVEPRTVV